MYTGWST